MKERPVGEEGREGIERERKTKAAMKNALIPKHFPTRLRGQALNRVLRSRKVTEG